MKNDRIIEETFARKAAVFSAGIAALIAAVWVNVLFIDLARGEGGGAVRGDGNRISNPQRMAPDSGGYVPARISRGLARLSAGDFLRQVMVDGVWRTYRIHVPTQYDKNHPLGIILVYHGGHTNDSIMQSYIKLDEKAGMAGFAVIYPLGLGVNESNLFFNASLPPRYGETPDDVEFTAKLLDDAADVLNVDRSRIFATGICNGGMMCYRLAAELSDRIAAIAVVAGAVAIPESRPKRAVSVLHFHGTKDPFVAYDGHSNPPLPGTLSVDDSVGLWARLDGCGQTPTTTELQGLGEDGIRVFRRDYGPGQDGAQVLLYTIDGGGHTWPGIPAPQYFFGKSTLSISANDLMLEFFGRHPMKVQK